ncbi:hypothetical protein niasHT_023025 [Heterodera trifolii]|uniref:14-3-3 domain-containing protein n=1 Tax=Heterodera trifolii TaxID=157864 RepID=A0ABD2JXB0_9BILA
MSLYKSHQNGLLLQLFSNLQTPPSLELASLLETGYKRAIRTRLNAIKTLGDMEQIDERNDTNSQFSVADDDRAEAAYSTAHKLAQDEFQAIDHLRLGVALNYAIFQMHFRNGVNAKELAQQTLIDEKVLPHCIANIDRSPEVYYTVIKGDFYRYASVNQYPNKYDDRAEAAYSTAHKLAQDELQAIDHLRLGVALNYAIFQMQSRNGVNAKELAQQLFSNLQTPPSLELASLLETGYKRAIRTRLNAIKTLGDMEQIDERNDTNSQFSVADDDRAEAAYSTAHKLAQDELQAIDHLRLGVALNYAIFQMQFRNGVNAKELAQQTLIDEKVLPHCIANIDRSPEVYYTVIKGDFYRYASVNQYPNKYDDRAEAAYSTAHKLAQDELQAIDHLRLGVALNYAIFQMQSRNGVNAKELAQQLFSNLQTPPSLELASLLETGYKRAIRTRLNAIKTLGDMEQIDERNDTNSQFSVADDDRAEAAYSTAHKLAQDELQAIDHLRLGVALNYAIFQMHFRNGVNAKELAQQTLIDEKVLPHCIANIDRSPEVYYTVIKGDFYRYASVNQYPNKYDDRAEAAYSTAHKLAQDELQAIDHLRLGVALNYAIFQMQSRNGVNAKELAQQLFSNLQTPPSLELASLLETGYKRAIRTRLNAIKTLGDMEQIDERNDTNSQFSVADDDRAEAAYSTAHKLAQDELQAIDHLRLGVALNYAIFQMHFRNGVNAKELAQQTLIDEKVLPHCIANIDRSPEVYYTVIKGDFYRYASVNQYPNKYDDQAEAAYSTAHKLAQDELQAIDHLRLGVALNYAIFQMQSRNGVNAKELAQQETVEDIDKDKDGFVDTAEYTCDMYRPDDYPELKGKEPEWVESEREMFKEHRDKNKDSKLNKARGRGRKKWHENANIISNSGIIN